METSFDVVVPPGGRSDRGYSARPTEARASDCSRKPTRWVARARGPAAWCGSRSIRTWPSSVSTTAEKRRPHIFEPRSARTHRRPTSPRRLIDDRQEMVTWFERRTPRSSSRSSRTFRTTTPSTRVLKPGGGRSLECPLYPFADLGTWQDRVTVGPQLSDNITMSETSLGRARQAGRAGANWRLAAHPRRTRCRAGTNRATTPSLLWTARSNRAPACVRSN